MILRLTSFNTPKSLNVRPFGSLGILSSGFGVFGVLLGLFGVPFSGYGGSTSPLEGDGGLSGVPPPGFGVLLFGLFGSTEIT